MKNLILALCLTLNLTNCGPKPKSNVQTSKLSNGRSIASTELKPLEIKAYPSSFLKLLGNQNQKIQLSSTLKQYTSVFDSETFDRMMFLAKNVDDRSFTLKRKNSDITLDNGKAKMKVQLKGDLGGILMTYQGAAYDFSDSEVLNLFLLDIEKSVIDTTKPKGANLNNLSGFFAQCGILGLALNPSDSEAVETGWFILGGMALIAIAIAVAANRLGKSVKKTEHTVKHEVGVGKSTDDAINNLADAVRDVDAEVLSNNSVNVFRDGEVETVE